MSNFPQSRAAIIEESMGALLSAFVIVIQSLWVIPHNENKVPFLQMGPTLQTILFYIVELGMYTWAAKQVYIFFICLVDHEFGVEKGFCVQRYAVLPPEEQAKLDKEEQEASEAAEAARAEAEA